MTDISEKTVTHPAPHRTHAVLNQSVPRTDVNEFQLDTVLAEGVARHDADWATSDEGLRSPSILWTLVSWLVLAVLFVANALESHLNILHKLNGRR